VGKVAAQRSDAACHGEGGGCGNERGYHRVRIAACGPL